MLPTISEKGFWPDNNVNPNLETCLCFLSAMPFYYDVYGHDTLNCIHESTQII